MITKQGDGFVRNVANVHLASRDSHALMVLLANGEKRLVVQDKIKS